MAQKKSVKHVCYYCCLPMKPTKDNPARTDWCAICGHRGEGQKRVTVVDKDGNNWVVYNKLVDKSK